MGRLSHSSSLIKRQRSDSGRGGTKRLAVCLALAVMGLGTHSNADSGALAGSSVSVEIDPTTFVLDGDSLHLRYHTQRLPQWRLGVGTYAMDLPDALVDLKPANRDDGWAVKLNRAVGVYAERYFEPQRDKAGPRGWFLGMQLAHQNYGLARSGVAQKTGYDSVMLMPYGGYLQPINNNLYVQGWAGLGYTHKVKGSSTVAGEDYDVPALLPFATFHLGYHF